MEGITSNTPQVAGPADLCVAKAGWLAERKKVASAQGHLLTVAGPSHPCMSSMPVLVRAFVPLPSTLSLSLPATATSDAIHAAISKKLRLPDSASTALRVTTLGGRQVPAGSPLTALAGSPMPNRFGQLAMPPLILQVTPPVMGGKGGFGSMLRAQGGKMSSNRRGEENQDACRDLNGRRLSTVKQARHLAAYLAAQEEREREMSEAQKKKYAKLEKMLGRKPRGEADFVEAANKLDAQGGVLEDGTHEEEGPDGGKERTAGPSSVPLRGGVAKASGATKRERIEDSEYLEQSRVIVDNVRSAVASAMMKKKRKTGPNEATTTGKASASSSSSSKNVKTAPAADAATGTNKNHTPAPAPAPAPALAPAAQEA